MRKNRMMRLASVLLVCVLLTTSVISGTFAKYVSTASGSDSARVAKWDIKVEDQQLGVENSEIVFDLFATVMDTAGDENDVLQTGDVSVIAPGTSGAFTMDLVNDSEVNAKYTIELTEENSFDIPLQYSLDGATWFDDFGDINTQIVDQPIAMQGEKAQHIVYWRWVFDAEITDGAHAGQTNAYDTSLGVAAMTVDQLVTITATVTVEQVD